MSMIFTFETKLMTGLTEHNSHIAVHIVVMSVKALRFSLAVIPTQATVSSSALIVTPTCQAYG